MSSRVRNRPVPSDAWASLLELDRTCAPRFGSRKELARAIRGGADLRIYTEFFHEEHIAPFGSRTSRDPANRGLVKEVIDFRVTYLVRGEHVAGITMLRQPVEPSTGFYGVQPKMSLFLYNMDGQQACAYLLLDRSAVNPPGMGRHEPTPTLMPKMSPTEWFDMGSSAPSRNFIYEMERYRFFVRDEWTELLAHDRNGRVKRGSFAAVERAQDQGKEIKVGLEGLCADLGGESEHEVFTPVGSTYLHTRRKHYETLTHPVVRVAPGVPLRYGSRNWDISWIYVRSDGHAVRRTLNPFTRKFRDTEARMACRWFAR